MELIALSAATQAANEAIVASEAAQSAGASLDDTEALNTLISLAQTASNKATEHLNSLLNELKATAVKLNLNLDNNETSTILNALKTGVENSATLDDIDATINATATLKNAQDAANAAQLSEVASIKATIDAISKAIEATQASSTLASSQLDVTIAARDDAEKLVSLQVAAAIEELNSIKAEITSAAEKTIAFEAKAASALKTGETRIDDIKSAITASEDAQKSADVALAASNAAKLSVENTIIQKENAEKNSALSQNVFETASIVEDIDPELFEAIKQLNSKTQTAFGSIESAVADAQSASISAQTASSEASAAAVSANTALEALNLQSGNTIEEKIDVFSTFLSDINASFASVKLENIQAGIQLEKIKDERFELTHDADFAYSNDDLADIKNVINEAKEFLSLSLAAADNAKTGSDTATSSLVGIPSAVKIRTAAQSAADAASSAAATASGVSQEDTVTISGTIEIGDSYSIALNNKTFSILIDDQNTITQVVDAFISKINDPESGSIDVTASAGSAEGQVLLTANSAGVAFKASAQTINVENGNADNSVSITTTTSSSGGATQVAQVDSMTIAGTVEVGDVYGITINDEITISYTVNVADDLEIIRNQLINLINSDESLSNSLTASEAEDVAGLTLTAKVAGNGFTASGFVENVEAGVNDNQININTTTQNLLGADELAAEAESEAIVASSVITSQFELIKIKSVQAEIVVDASKLKDAVTNLNDALQPLLFDDDGATPDVNQNSNLIKTNSEAASEAASSAVDIAKKILNLENDEDGSQEADLRLSLAEAQTLAIDNASAAEALFELANNSRSIAAEKINSAAEQVGVDLADLSEAEIIASLEDQIDAISELDNLPESAELLLKISRSNLENINQLLKSADANLIAANKSVENANAQAALAQGVEDDLENLLAQAEAAAIAQADDDAEVLAVSAENSFAIATSSAKSVFNDISTALIKSENAINAAFNFEEQNNGSSLDALNSVKAELSSLQTNISEVISKESISSSDGVAISEGLNDLVLAVNQVVDELNQEFLISLSKELSVDNIIKVTIRGAGQDDSASVSLVVDENNLPSTDDALEALRDEVIKLIENQAEISDVVTVSAGFGFGDILITSASKSDGLFEIEVFENDIDDKLDAIVVSSSGIEGAIRSINEGLGGLADVASTIQAAVADAESSSQLARTLADEIDKDSDPQTLSSSEAQENLVTILAQEVVAKMQLTSQLRSSSAAQLRFHKFNLAKDNCCRM